jgi:type VI secretion system protein ImpB
MAESLQHTLDRVRRPRVQITYDVEDHGMMVKKELPFVVGVVADLSEKPAEELPELENRKFTDINKDNFHDVLAKAKPRLVLNVQDRLTGKDQKLPIELNFQHLDDFDPDRVAEQVEPLRELLEMRRRLEQLKTRMEGKGKVVSLLGEIMEKMEKVTKQAKSEPTEPSK